VQVVVGSDDALLNSHETRERVERHVRTGNVVYLESTGHLVPPQSEAVARFLETLDRKSECA
jgi:hypothetical protein